MELEPITKFELKPIEPKNFHRPFATAEFITLRANDVYVSDKLYARLNFPDHVVIAMDAKMRVLGIKETNEDDKFGYKITMQQQGGARIQAATYVAQQIAELLKGLDLTKDNVRFFSGKKSGDYVVFDLDKNERVAKRVLGKRS